MDYFIKLPQDKFIAEIAYLYHSLNMLHSFREGTGRTERVFFVQLIRNAGIILIANKTIDIKSSYNPYMQDYTRFFVYLLIGAEYYPLHVIK